MNISYAIQAHPKRCALATALANQLGCDIIYDPEPLASPNAWRTYKRALERTPDTATHRVIIQDDATICRNFRQVMPRVLAARPDKLLALFVAGMPHQSRMRLYWACERDEPFVDLSWDQWVPAVALAWPVEMIPQVLEWVSMQRWPATFTADDEIIGRAARTLQLPVHATVPSLVEHQDDVDSLAGNWRPMKGANPARVAACFIHPDDDPLDIDWTR